MPHYIPGKTITTYQNTYGNINTYGDMNIWGTYSGHSTSTTNIPGALTTQTYTRPGYTVGHYYPSALILIYDGANLDKKIWSATGAGASDVSDFRISGQGVLGDMLKKIPDCKNPGLSELKGYIGITYLIVTIEGNNYFPVIGISPNSPAQRAGLLNEDIITHINEEPTVNKSWVQIRKMLDGPEESEVNLKIQRMAYVQFEGYVNKTIDIKIIRAKRPVEGKK